MPIVAESDCYRKQAKLTEEWRIGGLQMNG